MSRVEADLKILKFANDLSYNHWNWTELEKEALRNRDLKIIGEIIKGRLACDRYNLSEFYLTFHDDPSYMHIHGLGRFDGRGATLTKISKLTGIPMNQIEIPERGRYSYDNSLAYLIHAKETTKKIYTPESVITIIGRDYKEIFLERQSIWLKGKEKKKISKRGVELIEAGIINGMISKDDLATKYYEVYVRNKRKFDTLIDNKSAVDRFIKGRSRAAERRLS